MNQFKFLFTSLVTAATLMATTFPIGAVPAKPTPVKFTMPDGTSLELMRHGDENYHYITTLDGYLLMPGGDGTLHFADIGANGELKASSVAVSDPGNRDAATEAFLQTIDRTSVMDKLAKAQKMELSRIAAKVAPESELVVFPTQGSPKALVLLAEFSDVSFTVDNPQQQFYDLLNKENYSDWGATGSARDYYSFCSDGQFTPQFDVYGPVRVENPRAYYGGNNSAGKDTNAAQLIADACEMAHNTTDIDFSQYDTDNDGVVDNIYVFYAGYGEADSPVEEAIWPHAWYLSKSAGIEQYYDGKLLNHYACSAELSGESHKMNGIGTFVHEFTHVLGFMDLYSTSYTAAFSPGTWSLMDKGSYNNDQRTPPAMTVYERYCMGWVDPAKLAEPENVTMRSIHDGGFNDCRLLETSDPNEYFLFENRTIEGWDAYIPGEGMLVWHIDYDNSVWRSNQVNDDASHQYVDIIEADNILTDDSRDGDAFPGASGVGEFSFATTPSLASWIGENPGASLSDIKSTDGVVHFLFNGGEKVENVIELSVANEEIAKTSFRIIIERNGTPTSEHSIDVYSLGEDGQAQYVQKGVPVEGDSHFVDGVEPGTTYYCVLHYRNGYFLTHTPALAVTTLEPTLDYLKVDITGSEEISCDSFVAKWQALKDAEWYTLDLFNGYEMPDQSQLLTFDNELSLPEGWTTTSTNTYNGTDIATVPALLMRKDGQEILSPEFDGAITKLSFVCVANAQKNENNSLEVYVSTASGWESILTVKPIPSEPTDIAVTEIPLDSHRVKLVFNRVGPGNVIVDDIAVSVPASGVYTPVEGFSAVNVGSVTSYKVEGLNPDTDYFFTVTAHNDTYTSRQSDYAKVTTTSVNSVDNVAVAIDSDAEVFNLHGIRVEGALAPGIYIVRHGTTAKKLIVK